MMITIAATSCRRHTSVPGKRLKSLCRRCLAFCILFCVAAHGGEMLVLSERLQHYTEIKYGAAAKLRVAQWRALVVENAARPPAEKLESVNRFINRIPYVADQANWGVPDYWATPYELLAVNGGDCEDYAIAKYFSLLEMGVAAEQLQMLFVLTGERLEPHIVLAYQPADAIDPLILDNLSAAIEPLSQRHDLSPLYAFNPAGLWHTGGAGRAGKIGRPERIAQWMDLLIRINREIRRGDVATVTTPAAGLRALR